MGWTKTEERIPTREDVYLITVQYGYGVDLARFGPLPHRDGVGFYAYSPVIGYYDVKPERWLRITEWR